MGLNVRGMTALVQVFDMPRSIHFYRDLLGFEVVESSAPGDDCGWALLRLGGGELMLNTAYEPDSRPAAPDAERQAAHRDTGLFFACPDVDGTYRLLRELGLDPSAPVVRHYGMKQLYLTDPDGYELCFQWPDHAGH